jgi:NTE family protein
MLSQQPPLTMSFIKKSFKFSANFANLGTGCLSLLGGCRCLNIQVMPWVGLETIIGPIEIKHTWSPETKNGYTWFSVGFLF